MNKSKEKFLIGENGAWINDSYNGHMFDQQLCHEIGNILKEDGAASLVDMGCGPGWYVSRLQQDGFNVKGYDGNPHTPDISLAPPGLCEVLDLSKAVDLGRKFDFVLSLEVGEHIPPEFEDVFVTNLVGHCSQGIIMSWAVEGQGGDGHVNCRNNDYIIERMLGKGLGYDDASSLRLRKASRLSWFGKTLMVFRK